jgi:adenylosuccinate synthase
MLSLYKGCSLMMPTFRTVPQFGLKEHMADLPPLPTEAIKTLVVVGAQWGDEGKAKVVDLLAETADVVIRSQGGCNAGHTVQHNGETFKFHHLPSGLLYGDKVCVIGSGVVLSPTVLAQELAGIHSRGYTTEQLYISERCHVTFPYHIEQDKHQEALRCIQQGGSKIGTTGRGIGPTYMDKVGRLGIRVIDLFEDETLLRQQFEQLVQAKGFVSACTVDWLMNVANDYRTILSPYVANTVTLLQNALKAKQTLLFEGAQGTLLDVDFGTYPYVTSSNATAGGACTGTGVGPSKIEATLGVMKAYLTRVGEGPFPTECLDNVGETLCDIGQEYGTTTGRKRRCGWFDAVVARYSVEVNGLDGIALTKLDVLDTFEEINVAVAYKHRSTDEVITDMPTSLNDLALYDPVYETLPGWQANTVEARSYDALPEACKAYLERLEQLCGCPIWMVSVGPDRSQTLHKYHPFLASNTTALV